jgi:hemerythrin
MIVANIKSNADLKAKKELQKQLLDLEVANEGVRQARQKETGVKETEAKKIQEQYKTPSELQKDKVSLEKKALDYFIELGLNYNEAGQMTNWLTLLNRLADFNSSFKTIKKDISESYDKTLINTEFLKNYLNNFFDDLDANLGKKFSKDIAQENIIGSTFQDIDSILPDKYRINLAIDGLQNIAHSLSDDLTKENVILQDKTYEIMRLFRLLQDILPTEDILNDIASYFTQNERVKINKDIIRAYNRIVPIDRFGFDDIINRIEGFAGQALGGYLNRSELDKLYNRLSRELSGVVDARRRELMKDTYRNYLKTISTKGTDYEKRAQEVEALFNKIEEDATNMIVGEAMGEAFGPISTDLEAILNQKTDNQEYLDELFAHLDGQIGTSSPYRGLLTTIVNKYKDNSDFSEEVEEAKRYKNRIKGVNVYEGNKKDIQDLTRRIVSKQTDLNENYNPRDRTQAGYTPIKIANAPTAYGLGVNPKLVSKLKKHFKGDEKLLKKVAKALTEDSSSDEEEMKELNRHIKATDKVDKQIEKEVGKGAQYLPKAQRDAIYSGMKKMGLGSGKLDENTFKFLGNKDKWHEAFSGVGFKATRIPTSKVGKGVKLEKEDNPTYRQFGKYVIHIPHLLNNKTANFKYPSLGSIPTIKPLTISDDYKDLLLEVLQTGKLNKKELERLPQNEIKHFERVAVGAGLVEQLGMKIGNTEEDKADAKRFELLRGEYLAGNNNDKMIKELRQLITKFINTGRLHKTEGLNLLLELSTM